jgi:hypothetical protein
VLKISAARNSIGVQICASPLEQPNESTNADEDCDWLHRNDTYQMKEIRGRLRPVNIPLNIPSATPFGDTPADKFIGIVTESNFLQN